MDERNRSHYKHIDFDMRKSIEALLDDGRSVSAIAKRLDIAQTSVSREIRRNRRCEGLSTYKVRARNDCECFRDCKVCDLCGNGCRIRYCKSCRTDCTEICAEYRKLACSKLTQAPYVCNSCGEFNRCPLERFRYSANAAEVMASSRARESREGLSCSYAELADMSRIIKEGLALGQSVHHMFETRDMPVSERTFYRYVQDEDIDVISLELAKKVKYKKRKKDKVYHPSGFYKHRQYSDWLALAPDARQSTTQLDTVIGKRSDRKCILSVHRPDLHFQIYILLKRKTSHAVVSALDWLEICCGGPDAFKEVFGILLMDRGSEFDDIIGMERAWHRDGGKRASCYFTDPSRPDQKGACEKNHVELRKIIPKGTSLDGLDPVSLAEICCHVNSTVRKGCGNATPFALAKAVFPQRLFDELGLEEIDPEHVIGAPGIIYGG